VPLGTRDVVGVVWDDPPDPEIGHNRLGRSRQVSTRRRSTGNRRFVDWVASYTLTAAAWCAHGAARAGGASIRSRRSPGVRRTGPPSRTA
jgi:primosomal protein N' (replication factor Y) (superfamily II helicase)